MKDPYLVALGIQIRERRLARGWSQDEFAARAGMHRTHPTKLENGLLDPRLSTLRRVAKVLDVEVRSLLPTGPEPS
ncbi:helix-turn-helix domain-containing protein [Deinococcus alpinitundrae]|uniref:helix-turn-helix domain-containing protein n=1 Tax=Deinococcus alpinitundrae TaxID=468913 RepID=UPI00192A5390|nr:helix-turn-helix transcriptional regulator [Deinococcus alpinitundrae]